jgi:hypothetical protein
MNGKIRAGWMGVFLVYLVNGCLALLGIFLVKDRAMNGKIRAGWMGVFLVYLV